MASTLTYTGTLVTETCWCGMHHAIPKALSTSAHDGGTTVYCPLGHAWSYKETEADRLRKQLAAAEGREARRVAQLDQERAEREAVERQLAATKGVLTKTRKRVQNGVCPCCNRTFANVARHMATKHPDALADVPPEEARGE